MSSLVTAGEILNRRVREAERNAPPGNAKETSVFHYRCTRPKLTTCQPRVIV